MKAPKFDITKTARAKRDAATTLATEASNRAKLDQELAEQYTQIMQSASLDDEDAARRANVFTERRQMIRSRAAKLDADIAAAWAEAALEGKIVLVTLDRAKRQVQEAGAEGFAGILGKFMDGDDDQESQRERLMGEIYDQSALGRAIASLDLYLNRQTSDRETCEHAIDTADRFLRLLNKHGKGLLTDDFNPWPASEAEMREHLLFSLAAAEAPRVLDPKKIFAALEIDQRFNAYAAAQRNGDTREMERLASFHGRNFQADYSAWKEANGVPDHAAHDENLSAEDLARIEREHAPGVVE